jgi:hypothetical protein
MKLLVLLLTFFLIFCFIDTTAQAQNEVSLTLDTSHATLVSGGVQQVTATIANNEATTDTFAISAFPPFWHGATISFDPNRVTLGSGANGQIKILFSASKCVEEFSNNFIVKVTSIQNSQIQSNASISISTERKFQICVSDVKFNKDSVNPGETATINIYVENPANANSLPVTLITNVKSVDGNILQTFMDSDFTIQGGGTAIKSHSYTFGNFSQPGFYTFEVVLKDNSGTVVSDDSFRYRVGSVEKVSQTKDISYGLLLQTVTIKVRNDGNEAANNVVVKETVPAYLQLFFFPIDQPLSPPSVSANDLTYTWLIPTILPGEVKTVTYQIAIWNAVLVIIGVVLLVMIAFRYVFTIRIVKSYKRFATVAGAKEIQIQLEVSNKTRHVHKDVIVRDFVPSTAHVIEQFDTLKPNVRKTLGGTEVLWKFDTLRPREERVITYRIKPAMEIVGEILLPKASVRYVDRSRQIRRSVSKNVEIRV